jgi:hypothetical protein
MPSSAVRVRSSCAGLVVVLLVASAVMPSPARAESFLLRDTLYEVSPLYMGGYFFSQGKGIPHASMPLQLSGIRIHERNGIGGKLVAGTIVALVMAMGSSNKEYLGSTYGRGYRIDYYRMKSPAELEAERRARDEALKATLKNDYQMDLQVYFPVDGLTTARGFSWSLYPWSWAFGDRKNWILELGFAVSSIYDSVGPCAVDAATGNRPTSCKREDRDRWHYIYFGTPIRFIAPITMWAYFDLTFNFNYLYWMDQKETRHTPHDFRALFTLNPIERLFVRGGAIISGFSEKGIAYTGEVGVRF